MTTTPTASPELPDLDRLEALARAATPSPWGLVHVVDRSIDHLCLVDRDNLSLLTVVHEGETPYGAVYRDDDARFMAAANPAAVLALIALARRVKPEGEAPQAEVTPFVSATVKNAKLRVALERIIERPSMAAELSKEALAAPAAQHAESGAPATLDFDEWFNVHSDGVQLRHDKTVEELRAALAAQSQGAHSAPGTPETPAGQDVKDAERYRALRDAKKIPGQVWNALETGEDVDEAVDLLIELRKPIPFCEPCKAGRHAECEQVFPCVLPRAAQLDGGQGEGA